MPYPQEYQLATHHFNAFFHDVKEAAMLTSGNMAYSMTQSVFQVFRRRLSLEDAIRFSNILPAGIRALFVAEWNPSEQLQPFEDRAILLQEVQQLRTRHNFSFMTEDAIHDVAKALRKHVDEEALEETLRKMPKGALEYWSVR